MLRRVTVTSHIVRYPVRECPTPDDAPGTRNHGPRLNPSLRPQVLIVEDEPAIASVFARFLRTSGFDPVTASAGSIALGLLSAQRWDAVVIDLHLANGPDGDEVIRLAAARDPGLPARTIFTTGDLRPEGAARVARLRCSACLAKPFPAAHLIEVVRQVVERDRARVADGRRHA